MHQRFDVGQLTNVEKTPQGGLRVAAHLTRIGVLKYRTDDGREIAEYRPPEEIFSEASMASLADAPLTVGHVGMVSPDNHHALSAGHVRDIKQDGDKVSGVVAVQGRKAIKAIEGGMREVSCGYTCDVENTSGVTPDGQRYDRIQRNVVYNHLALVSKGRAGSDVRLRLDAADDQVPLKGAPMSELKKVERIDGVEYELDTEAHAHAAKQRDAKNAAQIAELSKQTARADAAEADKANLAAEIATLKDPARLDAAVLARAALVDSAKKVLGAEVKIDGLHDVEIKRQVVAKVYPGLRLDEKDSQRTETLYEAACVATASIASSHRADSIANGEVRAAIFGAANSVDIMEQVRRDALDRSQNAWKQPLGAPAKEGT